jgi:hypothetical protein
MTQRLDVATASADVAGRLRAMNTVPELRVLVGREVRGIYGRALRSLWFRWRALIVLYAVAAAFFIIEGVRRGDVALTAGGVVLAVLIPGALAVVYLYRAARPDASLTLVTTRAHLVLAFKRRRGRLTIAPTDHWVDRRRIGGQLVRGQATAFRREVLRILMQYLIEHDATVTARAANPRVRKLYEDDLTALDLDPAPFLRGGRRLNVTSEQLRAQMIRTDVDDVESQRCRRPAS